MAKTPTSAKAPSRNRLNSARHRTLVPYSATRAARQHDIVTLVHSALRDFKVADASPDLQQISNTSTLELLTYLSNLETQLHLAELSVSSLKHDRDRYRHLARERLRKLKSLRSQL